MDLGILVFVISSSYLQSFFEFAIPSCEYYLYIYIYIYVDAMISKTLRLILRLFGLGLFSCSWLGARSLKKFP